MEDSNKSLSPAVKLIFSSYLADSLSDCACIYVSDTAILEKVESEAAKIRGSLTARFFRFVLYFFSAGIAPLVIWICWNANVKKQSGIFLNAALCRCGIATITNGSPLSETTPTGSSIAAGGFVTPQEKSKVRLSELLHAAESDYSAIVSMEKVSISGAAPIGVQKFRGLPVWNAQIGGNLSVMECDSNDYQREHHAEQYIEDLLEKTYNCNDVSTPALFREIVFSVPFINLILQSSATTRINWHIAQYAERIFLNELQSLCAEDNTRSLTDIRHKGWETGVSCSAFCAVMEFLAARVQHARPAFVEIVSAIFPEFRNKICHAELDFPRHSDPGVPLSEIVKKQVALLLCSEDSCRFVDKFVPCAYRDAITGVFNNDDATTELWKGCDWEAIAKSLPQNAQMLLGPSPSHFLRARTIKQAAFLLELWSALDPKMQLQILSRSTFIQNVLLGRWLDPHTERANEIERFCIKALCTVCKVAIEDRAKNPVSTDLPSGENSGLLELAIELCKKFKKNGVATMYISSERDGIAELSSYDAKVSLPTGDCGLYAAAPVGMWTTASRWDCLRKRRIIVEYEPSNHESLFLRVSGITRVPRELVIPLRKRSIIGYSGIEADEWYFETDYPGELTYSAARQKHSDDSSCLSIEDQNEIPHILDESSYGPPTKIAPTFPGD
ncbi:MAG: hypothetical protein LBH53_03570 [Puniceicoccales bacterium]|jgi:hypothetical protein|nr:hypothetical protein [Puniceicoccales bacterium]